MVCWIRSLRNDFLLSKSDASTFRVDEVKEDETRRRKDGGRRRPSRRFTREEWREKENLTFNLNPGQGRAHRDGREHSKDARDMECPWWVPSRKRRVPTTGESYKTYFTRSSGRLVEALTSLRSQEFLKIS